MQSVYDYYWATYSVDSNGLSGLGYNEMVRQCNMIGPATGEPDLENLHLLGSQKPHVSGRRRRRSSFPPTGVDVLPNVYNNQENVPNPESDGGRNTGACGTDDTLTGGETSKLTLKSDMKTVTAMSPRFVIASNTLVLFDYVCLFFCYVVGVLRRSWLRDHLR